MSLPAVITRCCEKWRAEGIALAPPIEESEIRRTWSEFRSPVSADVLLLYATIGGFQEYYLDDDMAFSLWPWDWLRKRSRETPRNGVVFSDHSIEVVTWEFRFETEQTSSVWSSHGEQTAPTLETFLEQYLNDPWQLL